MVHYHSLYRLSPPPINAFGEVGITNPDVVVV
jgi:hypothetical protein